jgi:hypothetical protein
MAIPRFPVSFPRLTTRRESAIKIESQAPKPIATITAAMNFNEVGMSSFRSEGEIGARGSGKSKDGGVTHGLLTSTRYTNREKIIHQDPACCQA